MKPSQVASTGLSALSAQVIAGSTGTGLTAAGTTTTDALELVYDNSFIGTAASGTGVRLLTGEAGQTAWIYNGGANLVLVYPPTGGTVNDGSTNGGLGLDAGKAMLIKFKTATVVTAIADDITPALLTANAIAGGDSSLGIDGQAAAQGGDVVITGGASSTATNAGGAVTLKGGTGNTSGAGGAANLTGGTAGATGTGGQVNITGGTPIAGAGGAVVIAGAAGVGTNKAGGLASVTGGASTGSATGGVASLVGGAASAATGAGGGVVITAADGNTTGAAGTVVITAGQGGTTNVAGGVASLTGGVGNGTGIGGVASVVGGVGGTGGATGKGGAAKLTGGASVATNADGGAAIIAGGAKNGGGFIGPVVLGNAQLMPIWYPQAAPMADGGDTPFTVTVAQLIAGMISMTPTTGRAITTPTGTEMDAGVAFADVPATFGFDFTIQNRAAFAATDDIITLTAGASGVTVTGSATVAPGVAARFRAVRTTTATWIFYKIAG